MIYLAEITVKVMLAKGAEDLPLPAYMTAGSAGLDIHAAVKEPTVIQPGEIKFIPTGLHIALPHGYEAQIRPRSGLALKHGISMVNTPGTIDADYRGEIGLIMINFGQLPFTVQRGERVAQMIINQVVQARLEVVPYLEETERSSGGFGSTGTGKQE